MLQLQQSCLLARSCKWLPWLLLQGLTDKYIGSWMKNQKRDVIVLATMVSQGSAWQLLGVC